jgi:putative transposase
MARLPRVIAVHGPHHVTQRGNGRRFVLDSDTDRIVYLDLLKQSLALHDVTMMGYCLISNHVHLMLVPRRAESLGLALKHAHGRHASYWNAIHHSSGHVWQGRYYSCPLDEPHIWEALRYTELNPVRAGAGAGGRILDVVQCRRPLRFRSRLRIGWVCNCGSPVGLRKPGASS